MKDLDVSWPQILRSITAFLIPIVAVVPVPSLVPILSPVPILQYDDDDDDHL